MSQFLRSGSGPEIVSHCTVLKRSMLLPQVAGVCALDDTFIQTCNRIQCPPTEGACTPGTSRHYTISYIRSAVNLSWCVVDPVLGGKALGANLGCDVPYYRTPYNSSARLSASTYVVAFVAAVATVVLSGAL
jgi:hypothetical protein